MMADKVSESELAQTNTTLRQAAEGWRQWARSLPGRAPNAARPAAALVEDFLELGHREALATELWPEWRPGEPWDLSRLAPLEPAELSARCVPADPTATYTSVCRPEFAPRE